MAPESGPAAGMGMGLGGMMGSGEGTAARGGAGEPGGASDSTEREGREPGV